MSNIYQKNHSNNEDSFEEINFKNILMTLLRGKYMILFITFLSTITTFFYLIKAKPIYKGSFNIVVKLDEESSSSRLLGNLGGGFLNIGKKNNENETQRLILKSPSVLMPVFQFSKSVYVNQGIDIKNLSFKNWVNKKLIIDFEEDSSVLKVEFIDQDKDFILKTLKMISNKYKNYSKSDREKNLNKTIEYLKNQTELTRARSINSLKKFNEFSVNNGLGNIDGFVGLGKRKLINQTTKAEDLLIQNYDQNVPNLKINPNNSKKQSKAGQRFMKQFELLEKYEAEYVDLSAKLKPNSKFLTELKLKIDNLRSSLKRPNEILLTYKKLENQANMDESILFELENNLEIVKLEKIKTPEPWEMISVPTIDEVVFPKKKRLLAGALFLSFFGSSLIAFAKEKYSGIIFSFEELKQNIPFNYLETIYENNQNLNSKIIKTILDIKETNDLAIVSLSDKFFSEEFKTNIKKENKFDFHYVRKENFDDLSKYQNVLLQAEIGKISLKNMKILNNYLLTYSDKIKGWVFINRATNS